MIPAAKITTTIEVMMRPHGRCFWLTIDFDRVGGRFAAVGRAEFGRAPEPTLVPAAGVLAEPDLPPAAGLPVEPGFPEVPGFRVRGGLF
jgi:hypothetical protein